MPTQPLLSDLAQTFCEPPAPWWSPAQVHLMWLLLHLHSSQSCGLSSQYIDLLFLLLSYRRYKCYDISSLHPDFPLLYKHHTQGSGYICGIPDSYLEYLQAFLLLHQYLFLKVLSIPPMKKLYYIRLPAGILLFRLSLSGVLPTSDPGKRFPALLSSLLTGQLQDL